MSGPPFSRILDIRRIGAAGMRESISASPEERLAIVAAYGLLELTRFDADFFVRPWKRGGLEVEGVLRALVVQACVVSLDPVEQAIEQPFSLGFLPPEALASDPKSVAEAEVIVQYDEDDPPDLLVGHTLDLGEIATEQFALALDPYPRAPGAALPETGEADGGDSPFAALSRLRDKD
jgi:hypothetical protein